MRQISFEQGQKELSCTRLQHDTEKETYNKMQSNINFAASWNVINMC